MQERTLRLMAGDDDWLAMMTIVLGRRPDHTRAALPHLIEREAGTIVTVCSVNAFPPYPLVIDYCAA